MLIHEVKTNPARVGKVILGGAVIQGLQPAPLSHIRSPLACRGTPAQPSARWIAMPPLNSTTYAAAKSHGAKRPTLGWFCDGPLVCPVVKRQPFAFAGGHP